MIQLSTLKRDSVTLVLLLLLFSKPLYTQSLNSAIQKDDLTKARKLIEKKLDLNYQDKDGATALFWAITMAVLSKDDAQKKHKPEEYLEIAKMLVVAGADLNISTRKVLSPLILSVTFQFGQMATLLLDHGAKIDQPDIDGLQPIHYAASVSVNMISLLLDRGADINAISNEGNTPLIIAIIDSMESCVNFLISKNADVHKKTKAGRTALHFASRIGNTNVIKLLLKNGGNLFELTKFKASCLHIASAYGQTEAMIFLLKAGLGVDDRDTTGSTPLIEAVKGGYLNATEVMLNAGAAINVSTNSGKTALYTSCENNSFSIANILLKHRANVNSSSNSGNTPLHIAAYKADINIIKLLLENGANVHAKNKTLYTPLHFAVGSDNLQKVVLLVQYGANVQDETDDKQTPFWFAVQGFPQDSIIQFIFEKGGVNFTPNEASHHQCYTSARCYEKLGKYHLQKNEKTTAITDFENALMFFQKQAKYFENEQDFFLKLPQTDIKMDYNKQLLKFNKLKKECNEDLIRSENILKCLHKNSTSEPPMGCLTKY